MHATSIPPERFLSFVGSLLLVAAPSYADPSAGADGAGDGCKPEAPIDVTLEVLEREGVALELLYTVAPRVPMSSLDWELRLPSDVLLVRGQRFGRTNGSPLAAEAGRARVMVPADDAYRKIQVVATGVFEGSDAAGNRFPETVVAERTLTFGEPPLVGPLVVSPEGGEMRTFVALPTEHDGAGGARAASASTEASAGGFTVTGRFRYQDKQWNYAGWTSSDPQMPIVYADVTVIDDTTSAVLGTGSTGLDGTFSIACTSAGVTDVVVRVDADTNLMSSFQRIRVTDLGGTEYTTFSPVFASHDTTLDLDVGTTLVLKSTVGSDEGNPFNCLDQAVDTWTYSMGPLVGAGTVQTVRIRWPGGAISFADENVVTMADGDAYDDGVVLHELGHVVQELYSDSENPGGTHFFTDTDQDPRLSVSEGYATALGGVVLIEIRDKVAAYVDMDASSQVGGVLLRLRHETGEPFVSQLGGSASEVAVACLLYDLLDDENSNDQTNGVDDDVFTSAILVGGQGMHAAFWDVLVGPMATASNLTMNDVWDGWFAEHGNGLFLHPAMQSLFTAFQMDFYNDAGEPSGNSEEAAIALGPLPVTTAKQTLYYGTGAPPVPGQGDADWYAAELVQGSVVSVRTLYPTTPSRTQADTRLLLRSPTGVDFEDEDSGQGRNAAIDDFLVGETGTWTMRVDTTHAYREYGAYRLQTLYGFQNFLPVITDGPTATPSTLGPGQHAAELSVTATDAQALTYSWTPLDGGTIEGSGATVTFVPPAPGLAGGPDGVFRIELVVTDALGASAEPAALEVATRQLYGELRQP